MVNSVIIQGRLAKDIEIKKTQSDVAYTEFTVCWSEKYKETETKCFARCKAWRSTAEFLGKFFKKGQELVVEGRLVTEEWEKDGQKQSRMVVVANNVNFCGSKSDNAASSDNAPASDDFMKVPEGDIEDLPFN